MRAPAWWTRRRFGLLVRTNLASVPAWAPVGQYADWYWAHLEAGPKDVLMHPSPMVETIAHHRDRWAHVANVDDFLPFLTFDDYDADAWTQLALDAGMGHAIMTAKHHDGLCWWDAPGTDRTVLSHGPRRNVLGEFAAACERADLTFGAAYSLLDWGDPTYPTCTYVDERLHPHVLDLVERYGARMMWGDGHWGGGESHWRSDQLLQAIARIDPEVAVNDRWFSERKGVRTFEYLVPDDVVRQPWETQRGLGASFAWNRAERSEHLLTPFAIVGLLTEVVAKGGHLLLAVGPDAGGGVPALHADLLRAAGTWVRAHRDLVDRGEPWELWGDDDCRYIVVDDVVHLVDVGRRGRAAALTRDHGRVTSVEHEGRALAFEQDARGLRIERPPRGELPTVFRLTIAPPPPPPIELFPAAPTRPTELEPLLSAASRGDIVQLGEGRYVGPAVVPAGVTLRGLGPDRTRIDAGMRRGIVLAAGARLEHCSVAGGGKRLIWLAKPVVRLVGDDATVLGCRIDGHLEMEADRGRITSCTAFGAVAAGADSLTIARSSFHGMHWDCAIDIASGSGHTIDSCDFTDLLQAIRLTGTVAATVRGNRVSARWWGVQLIDTEATLVIGNAFGHTMRAVDIDGGSLAEVTGNAAIDGDSGCVLQHGASDCEIAGNHWERCRIGLLAWDAGAFRHHDNVCVDLGEPDATIGIGP